jgi:phage terminase large subunit GpA-like protein
VQPRNEAWDLAVYARAQARHLTAQFTPAHWDRLTAQRQGPPEAAQPDLAALWAPDLKAQVEAVMARPPEPPRRPPRPARPAWFEPRRDWF